MKIMDLRCKNYIELDNGSWGGVYEVVFSNAKYFSNLEKLYLKSKIECQLSSNSTKLKNKNMRYFQNLKEIDLSSKTEDKIVNMVFDDGCKALFDNAKYFPNQNYHVTKN